MRLQVSLLVVLLACLAAGCGASSSSEGEDPAAAVPAGTLVYVEAAIRPEGAQGDAARALIAKFLPPGKTLEGLIDEASRKEGEDVVYSKDVEPWLGERIGLGVSDLTADEPTFVGAISVTDDDAAGAFLAEQGDKRGSQDGVDLYFTDDDDTWGAVRDGVLVFSETRAGVKRGLDAQDGRTLSESDTFKDALDDLPDERLGTLFVDTEGVKKELEADAGSSYGASEKAIVDKLLGDGKLEPITGALTATEDSATIETRFNGSGLARLSSFGLLGTGRSTELVEDAPADAFAVFGAADVGKTVRDAVSTYAGALGGAALTGQLQSQLGIDLQRDVYSWVGDVSVHARGATSDTVTGALVISATDEDAAATALPRLVAAAKRSGLPVTAATVDGADQAFTVAAPDVPAPVVVARAGDRVVAAFGANAAREALDPSSDTLAGSGRYEDAKAAIDGIVPSLVVAVPGVLALVDDAGSSDPDYAEAKPYLQKLDQVVTGSQQDGDTYRSLLTVTTK